MFPEALDSFGQILGVGQGVFCLPKSPEQGNLCFFELFVGPTLVLCSYVETLILDVMVIVFEYIDLREVF